MIRRLFVPVALGAALVLAAGAAAAQPLRLERAVLVMRHGVRAPTRPNAELAKYSDKPWPAWSVPPGDLTPHGGQTVALMGATLRRVYRAKGLLPAKGCPSANAVGVWADGADERTRKTGSILAKALAPDCGLAARFSDVKPRDPIFGGSTAPECRVDAEKARRAQAAAVAADPDLSKPLAPAYARLQAIVAPNACAGGQGTCFERDASPGGLAAGASSVAEDILLEYADGKPMSEVGWGRASAADIAAIMPIHHRLFALIGENRYRASRWGAPMARVILDALAGQPAPGGPRSGPDIRLLALAGHDTNLNLMGALFAVKWTLPGEPDEVGPSTALVFEVWRQGPRRYVRPVIYYETLDQLRALKPATARRLDLKFQGCASGPLGSCPLTSVRARVEALLPPGCGAP
ncbi:MAG: histidine-type phosphatase [Caulobacteraceae bacterium]